MLARGDEKVSDIIYEAYLDGARNDYIEPMFMWDAWQIAINKTKVNIKPYLEKMDENMPLVWDNIHVGTSKEKLKEIYVNKIKGA